MKRWLVGVLVLAVVLAGGYMLLTAGWPGVAASAAGSDSVEPEAGELPPVKAVDHVVAEARVVPTHSAALSLPAGGVVAEVLVTEGDSVEAGQVLIKLEAARQAAAVAQAEAGLQRAQAQLDELKAGPRPQEIEAAQAAVEAAHAGLARLTQEARPEEIQAAEATRASAQANLAQVLEGPDEDEITVAAAELRRSEIALQQAQWAYDEVAYGADVAASPQAAALEQATLGHETAVARYNQALDGPTQAQAAAAHAELSRAEADLALLHQAGSQAEIAAARAEVRRAQAQLELTRAGARPEQIAAGQAEVAGAEAALAEARAALAETELRAPFAGAVEALEAKAGEQVVAGTPLAWLADLSAWQVETDDLTELEVVGITAGDPVTITLDAIPGLELPGQVVRVKGLGENKYGDITYTVVVQPDRYDARLRWNMTAAAVIEPR
jgi:HlyD family secretion protein